VFYLNTGALSYSGLVARSKHLIKCYQFVAKLPWVRIR
jgi:hypothetical protein